MIRLVMKDYKKNSAYLNLRCNAYHWASYLIKHSNFVSDYISSHHLRLSDVKQTIAVMVEGLNWEYNVYQPRHNKLYTNLMKQQYLDFAQLRMFLIDFDYTRHDLYSANSKQLFEGLLGDPLVKAQVRLRKIFLHLYRKHEDTIFSPQNVSNNLKAANYILAHVNQFVGNHAHL